MKKLCVIGSINMDLVAAAERFPRAGETLTGTSFATFPGGKGANQAVAAAKLGADVCMAGKVGGDMFGRGCLEALDAAGAQTRLVKTAPGTATGIAVIEVDDAGENRILLVRDIFLLQLEIPLETVLYAARLLKKRGKTVILDPAPARALPDELFGLVDYITPNETELRICAGSKSGTAVPLRTAAGVLLRKGAGVVIAKAGSRGAYVISAGGCIHVKGFKVRAVDTTAAGDSFNAGFAVSMAGGNELTECVAYANAVGALSVTAMGAQSGMPTAGEVKKFLYGHRAR
jgi:ribokinase